jgi:acyl-CoA dehydrogenase
MTPTTDDSPREQELGAWRLPDELADLADTVRLFMATEVRPIEDTLPHDTTRPRSGG